MITINFCGSEFYILRFCGLFSSSLSEKWFVHLELNNPAPAGDKPAARRACPPLAGLGGGGNLRNRIEVLSRSLVHYP